MSNKYNKYIVVVVVAVVVHRHTHKPKTKRDIWTEHTSEQPPHCHLRVLRRILLSHEHSVKSPFEQARVIDQANAAALIACM